VFAIEGQSMWRGLIVTGLVLLLALQAQAQVTAPQNPAYLPLVMRALPTPTPTQTPQPVSAERERLVELINGYRANETACPQLTIDPRLMDSAQLHTQDMLTNSYFNTTGLDGSSMIERAARQGYIGNAFIGMSVRKWSCTTGRMALHSFLRSITAITRTLGSGMSTIPMTQNRCCYSTIGLPILQDHQNRTFLTGD
jgi:hypothetical protein